MSENLQKLIGVVVMAVLVVVGVVFTGGDDDESVSFQRNAALLGQVPMGGDLADLEIRIQRIEKLIGQIPELAKLREVLEQAESSLTAIESATVAVREGKETALRELVLAEREAVAELGRVLDWVGNAHLREDFRRAWDVRARVVELEDQVGLFELAVMAAIPRLNAQLAGIAPQFGPEFPGLGPMADMLCRTQLASWSGATAADVRAVWDSQGEFWYCAYGWLDWPESRWEMRIYAAVCLPGFEFPEGEQGPEAGGANFRSTYEPSLGRVIAGFGGGGEIPIRVTSSCQ